MVRTALVLAFWVGMVPLQVFLSRAERKWPGLIFPMITFLFSFLYPFNMRAGAPLGQVLFVWLLGNIPTLILLAICCVCRPKGKQTASDEPWVKSDMDKRSSPHGSGRKLPADP